MRVCQLKVIISIDHRDRTLQDFGADYDARCLEEADRIKLTHTPRRLVVCTPVSFNRSCVFVFTSSPHWVYRKSFSSA